MKCLHFCCFNCWNWSRACLLCFFFLLPRLIPLVCFFFATFFCWWLFDDGIQWRPLFVVWNVWGNAIPTARGWFQLRAGALCPSLQVSFCVGKCFMDAWTRQVWNMGSDLKLWCFDYVSFEFFLLGLISRCFKCHCLITSHKKLL